MVKFPPAGISINLVLFTVTTISRSSYTIGCNKERIMDEGPIQLLYHHCYDTLQTYGQHHSLSQHQHVSLTILAASMLLQHLAEKKKKKHKHALFPTLREFLGMKF